MFLISDKPPFQEHWNGTSKYNPIIKLMNILMCKAVTQVYVYVYVYK